MKDESMNKSIQSHVLLFGTHVDCGSKWQLLITLFSSEKKRDLFWILTNIMTDWSYYN